MQKSLRLGTVYAVLFAVVVLVSARPAAAQTAKLDAFAGGSFLRDNSTTFSGWNASVTGNALTWLGVTGDFSGHYNNGFHITTYTFGPRLSFPAESLAPFTQATFGAARLSAGAAHANGFAAYIGGGVDWYVKEHIGIRLMQLDAQLTRVSGVNNSATRISFGVVFRVGER